MPVDRLLSDAPDYPKALHQLKRPPKQLFVRGELRESPLKVAVVGSRKATEFGLVVARRLAKRIAQAGGTVVSGGALGIDAAAHEGALEGGGVTWVVLPTPLDKPSPRRNLRLFERVLAGGGAWLSEYDKPAGLGGFTERNRIVAALSDALLVIEARPQSGTRHTVRAAIQLKKKLGAVTWPFEDPRGEGARQVFQAGGRAISDPDALVAWLSLSPSESAEAAVSLPLGMDPQLWELLQGEAKSSEWLANQLNQPFPSLMVVLSQAELMGSVVQSAPGMYRRS